MPSSSKKFDYVNLNGVCLDNLSHGFTDFPDVLMET